LRFLIDTRAGLVEDEKIISWITQLHDVGALYEWRRYLPVHTGLLLIEDQQAVGDALGLFEQSSAAALSEYMANVSGT
jgi:hypothetical protein